MSTREEALTRLEAARHKLIVALRDAGNVGEADLYAGLPAPGMKGWFNAYFHRMIYRSAVQGTALECERVRNTARRAGKLSRAMDDDLTLLINATANVDVVLREFYAVFAEVVEEGFSLSGFAKKVKPSSERAAKKAPARARRAKASPT